MNSLERNLVMLVKRMANRLYMHKANTADTVLADQAIEFLRVNNLTTPADILRAVTSPPLTTPRPKGRRF